MIHHGLRVEAGHFDRSNAERLAVLLAAMTSGDLDIEQQAVEEVKRLYRVGATFLSDFEIELTEPR